MSIAWLYQLDYLQIARANQLKPPYLIHVGQRLKIPNKNQYTRDISKNQKKREKQSVHLPKPKNASKSKRVNSQSGHNLVAKTPMNWAWPIEVKNNYKSVTNGKANGISIFADKGVEVKAALSGRVAYAGVGMVGYGNLVILDHQNSYLTAYANNSELLVVEGQSVSVGQVIARVGSVGVSKNQLYFEIRKNGIPQNPLDYLP